MSLKNKPMDLTLLDLSCVKSEFGPVPSEAVQQAHLVIYATCRMLLGLGRRDLLPLAAAWAHSSGKIQLEQYGNPEIVGFTKEVIKPMCDQVVDTLVLNGGEGAVVATEYGDEPTLNVCEILLRAGEALGEDCGALRSTGDALEDAFVAAGITPDQIAMFRQISMLTGVASLVVGMVQSAYVQKLKGGNGEVTIQRACELVRSRLPGGFDSVVDRTLATLASLHGKSGIEDVWHRAVDSYCYGSHSINVPEPPKGSTPKARRWRWMSGNVGLGLCNDRDAIEACNASDSISQFMQEAPADMKDELTDQFALTRKYIEAEYGEFVPMTFMSEEAYESFLSDKKTKTLWDLVDEGAVEGTWHNRYTDLPLHGRAITDDRLWGEKGRHIVYGALVHRANTDQIAILAGMYGPFVVTWQQQVLEWATITMNDSQASPFAFPANRRNIERLMVPFCMSRLMNWGRSPHPIAVPLTRALCGVEQFPEFLEIQIHNDLDPSMVSDVVDLT